MLRTTTKIKVKNISEFKIQLIQWAQQFKEIIWLDSNNYQQKYSNFDAILAIDAVSKIETTHTNAFEKLKEYMG